MAQKSDGFYDYVPPGPNWGKRILLGVGILGVGLAALYFWIRPKTLAPKPGLQVELARQIITAREAGRYDDALRLTDDALKAHPGDEALQDLSRDFHEPLKPAMNVDYLFGGTLPYRSLAPGQPRILTPNDEYYFTLDLRQTHKCYCYLFGRNSAGEWTAIFPNPAFATNANPLPPASYQIPDASRPRLRVKPPAGIERVFGIYSNWRIDALEQFARQLAGGSPAQAGTGLSTQLITRIRAEDANAGKMAGLRISVLEFRNAGEASAQANQR
jgi:hypothetical protein